MITSSALSQDLNRKPELAGMGGIHKKILLYERTIKELLLMNSV